MRSELLPFSRPTIGEKEIAEVVDVLRSGWLTSGSRVSRFEQDFARHLGVAHALSVTSCTAALHVALLAHGIGPGDEVVTPAMSWPAAANMVERAGARTVFADVERETLQLTADTLEPHLTERTRAVIPVHFAGAACDLEEIGALAARHGIRVIEDCAHALGTEYQGQRIGAGGGTACFSFHPIKNITTGEGGMLTTDDPELAARAKLLRFHGVSRDAWASRSQTSAVSYESVIPGFKFNMTDLQAALGIHQLARLDEFVERRTRLAELYRAKLAGIDGVSPLSLAPGTTRHAWHLFIVTLDLDSVLCDRDGFMELLKKRNIGTGLHFTAIHLHRYYRERYGYTLGTLPNTEWAGDRVLSLPLFPAMREEDVDDVCEAIRETLREVRR